MGKGEYIIQLPTRQVFFQKGGGGTYIQPSGRSAVNDCKLCVRGSSPEEVQSLLLCSAGSSSDWWRRESG